MNQAHDQSEYIGQLATYPVQAAVAIERAIQLLAPGASHSQAAKLFDNRAHWTTVRAWRRGWHSTPRWALDLMAAKLSAHSAIFQSAAELANAAPGFIKHTGAAGKQALNRYRAAQAAKRNGESK